MPEETTEEPLEEGIIRAVEEELAKLKEHKKDKGDLSHSEVEALTRTILEKLQATDPLTRELVPRELRHRAKEIFRPKEMRDKRIASYTRFIEEDIRHLLRGVVKDAVEREVRDIARIGRMAQDTSLDINQIILRARKEFEIDAGSGAKLAGAVLVHLGQLETKYSFEVVRGLIEEHTGLRFVRAVQRSVQEKVVHATAKFGKEGSQEKARPVFVQGVIEEITRLLELNKKEAAELFEAGKLLHLVQKDLEVIERQFTDYDAMMARFGSL